MPRVREFFSVSHVMKFNRKWVVAAIVLVLVVVAFRAFRREGYELSAQQRDMLNKIFTEPDTRLTDAEQTVMMKVMDGIDSNNPEGPLYLKPAVMNIFQRYPNLPQKMRGVRDLDPKIRILPSESVGKIVDTGVGMPSDSVGKNRRLNNFQCNMNMGDGAFACYPYRGR